MAQTLFVPSSPVSLWAKRIVLRVMRKLKSQECMMMKYEDSGYRARAARRQRRVLQALHERRSHAGVGTPSVRRDTRDVLSPGPQRGGTDPGSVVGRRCEKYARDAAAGESRADLVRADTAQGLSRLCTTVRVGERRQVARLLIKTRISHGKYNTG